MIRIHGHAVTYVPNGLDGTFCYTSGLSLAGLPEAVMTVPLEQKALVSCLNGLASRWKRRGFSAGKLSEVIEGYDVLVVPLDAATVDQSEMFSITRSIAQSEDWGCSLRYVQLVIPDQRGRYPDEPEYDQSFVQPLLL